MNHETKLSLTELSFLGDIESRVMLQPQKKNKNKNNTLLDSASISNFNEWCTVPLSFHINYICHQRRLHRRHHHHSTRFLLFSNNLKTWAQNHIYTHCRLYSDAFQILSRAHTHRHPVLLQLQVSGGAEATADKEATEFRDEDRSWERLFTSTLFFLRQVFLFQPCGRGGGQQHTSEVYI